MRILLINYEYPPRGGGAGNATREIGLALSGCGHEVSVLTGGEKNGITVVDDLQIIQVRSGRKHKSRASLWEMLCFLCYGMMWCRRQRRRAWDAAIVFFTFPSGPIATLLKKRWGIPYVLSLRGGDVPGFELTLDWMHCFLAPLRRKVYREAIAVVANSLSLKQMARDADSVEPIVIPNGIDTETYRPLERSTVNLPTPLKVLMVSRFHPQKGLPEAIAMLGEARRRGVDFTLTLVGDGKERSLIEEAVRDAELGQLVKLVGWQDKENLPSIYQAVDCLLNLSLNEGMPNVLLEAMSSALPIIASDIAPHREILDHGVDGYLVDIRRLDCLVKPLGLMNQDSTSRVWMGNNARAKALRWRSWQSVAEQYLQLIKFSEGCPDVSTSVPS